MTENEKLRALLAEARKTVHTILDIDALHGWACEAVDDEPALDDLMRDLRARIDAALAEPGESDPPKSPEWACYNCGSMGDFSPIQYAAGDYDIECANCGSKNTDEAGNVVQRLVLDLDEARAERDEARAEAARWREEGEGLLRYACEASAAYKAGAEAMREAAALEVECNDAECRCDGDRHAEWIRALPIPEDKR
jgi:hypothetical protein